MRFLRRLRSIWEAGTGGLLPLSFRRMRQEWRSMLILLLAISLVTGFLALGPLYIRGVTEIDLRYALDNAEANETRITLISQQPLTADSQEVVQAQLGGLITDIDRYYRADYSPPQLAGNQGGSTIAGSALCGFLFQLGQSPYLGAGATQNCYQPYSFYDLENRVRVVEGRLPQRTALPDEISGQGLTDEQQEAQETGWYNRGQVEAVVTRAVAEEGDVELGTRFFMGNLFFDGTGAVVSVRIVGIVEPNDPNDPLWRGNAMFLEGAEVDLNNFGATRFDFGLAFDPASYNDWVVHVIEEGNLDTQYVWLMDTDPTIVNADNANDVLTGINNIRSQFIQEDPTTQVVSGYSTLLLGYDKRVETAEGPITFLSGAVLILLLYHLITTVSLVLQQQGKEWSTITSRGASIPQLFGMQFVLVAILGLLSFGAAFGISRLFMMFLETFGPLSKVLGDAKLSNVPTPTRSIIQAGVGALVTVIALSLPSIPAARKSLLLLKQAASRPPVKPAWTRVNLDWVFIFSGLGLMFRLYYISLPGNVEFGRAMSDLVNNPRTAIRVISSGLTDNQGLNDPLNLLAPALLLTGFALLWLRFFPKLIGLISRVTTRLQTLTTPLAVWNVERDPGHYAQLVLLLIGTLALGTASIGLSATREVGAWKVAYEQTGGAARIEIDPTMDTFNRIAWDRLDGVSNYTGVMSTQVNPNRELNTSGVQIVALSPDEFSEIYPSYADAVEPLKNATALQIPGTLLPEDASELAVQVWSRPLAQVDLPEASVEINAYLLDSAGVLFVVNLSRNTVDSGGAANNAGNDPTIEVDQSTPPDQWVTLSGPMPSSGRAPYSMWRIGMETTQGEVISLHHTIYLDYWQTIDANGVATVHEDFEATLDTWQPAITGTAYTILRNGELPDPNPTYSGAIMSFVESAQEGIQPVVEGDNTALKLEYTIRNVVAQRSQPSLIINPVTIDSVPVVVSQSFAETYRGDGERSANANTRPLQIGDTRSIELGLNPVSRRANWTNASAFANAVGTIPIRLEIVGIIEDFPTIEDNNFIIMPLQTTNLWFNQTARSGAFFDVNEVWLETSEQVPSDRLRREIDLARDNGVERPVYAWDRYSQLLREPLPSAIAGMLYAGFWISLLLSLLDFAFYIAVTAQQRSFTFGVLRSLGWNGNDIWRLLLVEQATLIVPALIIGSILGAILAYLILPFLSLVGNEALRIPPANLLLLIGALVGSFVGLLILTAFWLRRMSVNQVLRLGEE